jgi:N utilization substance protein B
MGKRRQAREAALQGLYLLDMNPGMDPDDAIRLLFGHFGLELEARAFASQLIVGVMQHLPDVDQAIQAASQNWRLERMACLDRNLLRLAVFELRQQPAVPRRVVLNEAIEIAKRFGSAESSAFVNGILDRVALGDP